MASYYEQPQQFAPYVPEVNLQVFAQALAKKDQEYNLGVEKIRAYEESVSGLPVVNPQDREYLQGLTNTFNTEIIDAAGSDFSDPNMVNKFRKMASKIYQDPKVQQGIASASAYKKGQELMDEAKKTQKGYHIDNENYFNQQVADWMRMPAGTPFNSTYTPYVDVMGDVMKIYQGAHPDQKLQQDYDGNVRAYSFKQGKWVALDPNKVRAEIEGIISSNGAYTQQIGISSWNKYRGHTDEQMKREVGISYKMLEDDIKKRIKSYQIMEGETDNPNDLGSIGTSIKALENQLASLPELKAEEEKNISRNRDRVAADLYTRNLLNTTSSIIGYNQEELTYVRNPDNIGYQADQRMNAAYEKSQKGNQSVFSGFTPQGVKTQQQETPTQAFNTVIAEGDKEMEGAMINMMTILDKGRHLVRDFNTKNADGSTNYDKAYVGKTKGEMNASRAEALKIFTNEYNKYMRGDVQNPKIRDIMEKYAVTAELTKLRKQKVVEGEAAWAENVKTLAQTQPEYETLQKIADLDMPNFRRVNESGRAFEVGKRALSKGLSFMDQAIKQRSIAGEPLSGWKDFNPRASARKMAESLITDPNERAETLAAIDLAYNEYYRPLGTQLVAATLSGQPMGTANLTPDQKKIHALNNIVKSTTPGVIMETDKVGKAKADFMDNYLNKYINVNTYNSQIVSSPGSKQENEVIGMMVAKMNALEASMKDGKGKLTGVPDDLKDEYAVAKNILMVPNLKNVTVEYHQPPGKSPYMEITGPESVNAKSNSIGIIPLTEGEATNLRLFKTNDAKLLDNKLALNRMKSVGTSVIERAENMRIGPITDKYFVSYDVENNEGAYRVTLKGVNKETNKSFVIPVDSKNPFQNTQQIIYWVNSMLLNNPATAAQLITKAIATDTEYARGDNENPAGGEVVAAQPNLTDQEEQ